LARKCLRHSAQLIPSRENAGGGGRPSAVRVSLDSRRRRYRSTTNEATFEQEFMQEHRNIHDDKRSIIVDKLREHQIYGDLGEGFARVGCRLL
jgi:hypothetical protein